MVQQVNDEAAGLLEIIVVRPLEILDLLAAARPENRAGKLASLAMRTVLNIHDAPARDPVQCMTCCRSMTLLIPCSVVLAIPYRDAPEKALASVMCADCATDLATIRSKAIDYLRSTWPDLRPITIGSQVGHA